MKRFICGSLVCAVLLVLAPRMRAQVQTGTPQFGSFAGGPDVINLGNLNSHHAIPVLSKPGRGNPFSYALSVDSSVWIPVGVSGSQSWYNNTAWGWRDITEMLTGFGSNTISGYNFTCPAPPPRNQQTGYHREYSWIYHDRFGALHAFPGVSKWQYGGCGTYKTTLTATATDGSGYVINVNGPGPATITAPSGLVLVVPIGGGQGAATATDANGNQISVSASNVFTDTLGTTALTVTGGAPNPLVFTYTDSSGAQRSVTMNYTTYTVQTNFGCSGISEYGPMSASLVSSISFPDGTSESFTYEPTPGFSGNVTGRVQSITLRTGGTITYAYTGGNYGIMCADGSTAGLTRTTSDGPTTYSRSGSGASWTTTVTDPQNNQTVINFQTVTPSGDTAANFYETHRTVNQGASTVLAKMDTCYNGATPDCTAAAITLPFTEVKKYVTLNNNQQSLRDTFLNSFGLTTQVNEYDFGSSNPGPVLRETSISYATLGNGIVSLPSNITVQDGGGHQQAQTTFGYDETTPTATSGVPQHTAISGSRGNLTSLNQWLNTTGGNLTTTFTYDDAGNVLTTTDPGGHQTQFTYADNFADGINRSSLAYVTQLNLPDTSSPNLAHHITKAQYDANTGLPVKTWDQSNNFTTFAYDLLLRPTQINFPDGGQRSMTYGSTGYGELYTGVYDKIDSARSRYAATSVDGYGRTSRTTLANGESNPYDQQDFCYDSNGRLQFQSYAYQNTGFSHAKVCSGAGDSFSYDALGRIKQLTHSDGTSAQASYTGRARQITDEGNGTTNVSRIAQSDGLGRLTSICEISSTTQQGSNNTPAACGLDMAGTGFLTTYAYDTLNNLTSVAQAGLNPRSYVYDSLSRMTSETEPESGTTTYSYNSDSLLTQRVRPKVNQTSTTVTTSTNYVYDPLHRLTQRLYGDTTAPNAYFNYDETSPQGITVSNSVGRLTSEYNNAGPERILSYDVMGRVTADWLCPLSSGCNSSGNYKEVTYGYDLAGDMTTLNNNGAGVIWTYAYNVAPRPSGVTSNYTGPGHPANLISGAHFNAFGQLTSATYGDATSSVGISETRSYNGRGQIQSVWSQINGGAGLEAFSGVTYAPNGNITAVNDAINYGNWTYGYDDLNRLKSAGYTAGGNPVNYTYDYDRYSNRWRQTGGTTNWSQAFDSNNHILGWSYDALGNLLSDGSHAYAYDAEGRLLTVDGGAPSGTNYVYDAEQRRVSRTTGTGSRATHWFTYDLGGHEIMDYDSVTQERYEVYAGSKHLATYTGQVYFPLVDWLGNERVKSTQDETGEQSFANLPFGDGQAFWGYTVGQAGPMQFTGDEHDSESNLEHTWFRQYSSAQGRWITPDPWLGSMDLSNPQSLNRYAYVLNNPMNLVDPFGLKYDCGGPCTPFFLLDGSCIVFVSYYEVRGPDGEIYDMPSIDAFCGTPSNPGNDGGDGGNRGGSGDKKTNCPPTQNRKPDYITNGNGTIAMPGAFVGALIGAAWGGEPGAALGGALGSMFGIGPTVSKVSSTNSWYVGVAVSFTPTPAGGNGVNVSRSPVPPDQNANSIANGLSFSTTFQSVPFPGITITKSPGQPAIVGPSVGTRAPVSFGASRSWCVYNCGCNK